MKEVWRWFGPYDLGSLEDIIEAGAPGIEQRYIIFLQVLFGKFSLIKNFIHSILMLFILGTFVASS